MSDATPASSEMTTPGESPASGRNPDSLALVGLLAGSAAYLLPFVDRSWIPNDVGLLGQIADRVGQGQLPHRDFIDMYTGGLSLLHGAAFRAFGIDAIVLRWLLYCATLLALPLIYGLARRAASPLAAAAATAVAVVWSVPLYFESMPSWYNLFLAAAAFEALLRARGDRRVRWLLIAGLCAGTSIAIKSIGALVVATAFLYFVYQDQERRPSDLEGSSGSWFVTAGLTSFLALLLTIPAQRPSAMNFIHFGLPGAQIVALLLWREWRGPSGTAFGRFRDLLREALPFLFGCALPLGALALPYVLQGALSSLFQWQVVLHPDRIDQTFIGLPGLPTLVCVLPYAAIFVLSCRQRLPAVWDRRIALLILLLGTILVAYGNMRQPYQLVWFGLRPLVPLAVAFGSWRLLDPSLEPERSKSLFVVLAGTALCSLVQFPNSMGYYFAYTAPLAILAYLHAARAQPSFPRRTHGAVALVLTAFCVIWVAPSRTLDHGILSRIDRKLEPLGLERASLRTSPGDAATFRAVVGSLQALVPADECIWAGPELPEVYFLSDRCNPTPTLTEIFDPDYGTPEHPRRILRIIDEQQLKAAVLNRGPAFAEVPPGLLEGLSQRYEDSLEIRRFLLFWNRRPLETSERELSLPSRELLEETSRTASRSSSSDVAPPG